MLHDCLASPVPDALLAAPPCCVKCNKKPGATRRALNLQPVEKPLSHPRGLTTTFHFADNNDAESGKSVLRMDE